MFFAKIRGLRLIALCLMCPIPSAHQLHAQNGMGEQQAVFSTFQIAGSSFTNSNSINNAATVTGTYAVNNGTGGYVRVSNGVNATIKIPGSTSIAPASVSQAGAITGSYSNSTGLHGFLFGVSGAITSFDVPGNSQYLTEPTMINSAGTIIGEYSLPGQENYPFVRAASGTITTFDVAGGTNIDAAGLNEEGAIVGSYDDATPMTHSFLRYPSGSILSFDPPGIGSSQAMTINTAGTIAGLYATGNSATGNSQFHVYIRASNGTFTTFDVPGNFGINNVVINAAGIVAGSYLDDELESRSFVRTTDGVVTEFDPPNGTNTQVTGIDDFGAITGVSAVNRLFVGFIRYPTGGEKFQAGTFNVADGAGYYLDGGFYLYGDPTVRLWTLGAGNPSQHWQFSPVSGGFTLFNQGTGQYGSEQSGVLKEGSQRDVWTVTEVPDGYSILNNRTGHLLTDPAVKDGAVTLTGWGSVWELSQPQ